MNRGSAQVAGRQSSHESRGKPGMNRGTGRPVQSPWIEGQAGHESRICPACLQAEQQWSWIEEESPMNRGADQAWIEGLPSLPCNAFCSPSVSNLFKKSRFLWILLLKVKIRFSYDIPHIIANYFMHQKFWKITLVLTCSFWDVWSPKIRAKWGSSVHL